MQINHFLNPPADCSQKADINYPCLWLYKVIGQDVEALQRAITAICPAHNTLITPSLSSSGGKYHSLNVEIEVNSEEARLAIYQRLKNHMAIKMVL